MVTRPARSRRATARDVAELAGRSLSTVSLVINGKDQGRVAAETRERILAAASELGYQLNTTASALARGELDSIGFVSPDPTNPFFSMVLDGLARKLDSDLSVTMLMPHGGEDYDLSTVQRALAGNLAGLILASPGTRLLERVVPTCATVILDSDGSAGSFPSIDLELPGVNQLAEARLRAVNVRDEEDPHLRPLPRAIPVQPVTALRELSQAVTRTLHLREPLGSA